MRVIITGAAGRIGSEIVKELSGTHELCLIDRIPVSSCASIIADLAQDRVRSFRKPWSKSRLPRWMEVFENVDVVLHLAADPNHRASWQQVFPNNIKATWNVIEAAARHRVPRVVFASSNWAVKALERALAPACYLPEGPKIDSAALPSPLTPYGISKGFGELTGHTFVDEQRLASFVAVRIGSYRQVPPRDEGKCRLWIGTQDLRSLLRSCVEVAFEGFHVVYGVSAQPTIPYDLSHTRRLLSWEPQQLPEQIGQPHHENVTALPK